MWDACVRASEALGASCSRCLVRVVKAVLGWSVWYRLRCLSLCSKTCLPSVCSKDSGVYSVSGQTVAASEALYRS